MTAEYRSEDKLEELDAETVEDLDVAEDAEDVRGGTTWPCIGAL